VYGGAGNASGGGWPCGVPKLSPRPEKSRFAAEAEVGTLHVVARSSTPCTTRTSPTCSIRPSTTSSTFASDVQSRSSERREQAAEHAHRAHGHHHGESEHGHSHGLVDRSIVRSRTGVKAVSFSLELLGAAALVQVVIFVLSGLVALLADLIHNFGDALTAVPLGSLLAQLPWREAGRPRRCARGLRLCL
jgi:hypothetical protein